MIISPWISRQVEKRETSLQRELRENRRKDFILYRVILESARATMIKGIHTCAQRQLPIKLRINICFELGDPEIHNREQQVDICSFVQANVKNAYYCRFYSNGPQADAQQITTLRACESD